jgi:hypothetical protein
VREDYSIYSRRLFFSVYIVYISDLPENWQNMPDWKFSGKNLGIFGKGLNIEISAFLVK